MYENICYKKNFVKEVVCRLDFANNVEVFDVSFPKDVYDVINKYFPIVEPREILGASLQVNPMTGDMLNNRIVTKQWVFWTRDKKSNCIVQSNSVVFSIHNYGVYEDLKDAIINILKAIMNYDENVQGKRLGLRYVNAMKFNENDGWITEKYFDAICGHKSANTMRLVTTLEYS